LKNTILYIAPHTGWELTYIFIEAPARLIREASLRLPLKQQETNNSDPFKRSTSLRAYSNHQRNATPQVKNWSDQLEAIKESWLQMSSTFLLRFFGLILTLKVFQLNDSWKFWNFPQTIFSISFVKKKSIHMKNFHFIRNFIFKN